MVPGQLMELLILVYGFADAPRHWWRKFREVATNIGFLQCSLDLALFVAYSGGKLIAVLGVHVDDIIGGDDGSEGAQLRQRLAKALVWGDWSYNVITFCGRQIKRLDGGRVTVDQQVFAQSLEPPTVPKHRSVTPDAALTSREETEARSGVGSLRWLVSHTRPDIAAASSILSHATTVRHLQQVVGLMRTARASATFALVFLPIALCDFVFVAFGDASWGTIKGLRSQAGCLLLAAHRDCLTTVGGQFNLWHWLSAHIKRVCRSSLSAETQAVGTALDLAMLARAMWCEVVLPNYWARRDGDPPPHVFHTSVVTDHRGLYDLLIKEGQLVGVQEKRLAIDLAGLIDLVELQGEDRDRREIVRWVPTWAQWADHLTKIRPSVDLRRLLQGQRLRLQANPAAHESSAGR